MYLHGLPQYVYIAHSYHAHYSMRNFLPVNLREGEAQTQLEEQPENNNSWTMPNEARGGRLGKRLDRALSASTDIGTILGMEHMEWVKLPRFLWTVTPFASEKEEAAKETKWQVNGLKGLTF